MGGWTDGKADGGFKNVVHYQPANIGSEHCRTSIRNWIDGNGKGMGDREIEGVKVGGE